MQWIGWHKHVDGRGWIVDGAKDARRHPPSTIHRLRICPTSAVHADAGGLGAIVRAGRRAIELAVADDALARLHAAVAALAGTLDWLWGRHDFVSSTAIVCPISPKVKRARGAPRERSG